MNGLRFGYSKSNILDFVGVVARLHAQIVCLLYLINTWKGEDKGFKGSYRLR